MKNHSSFQISDLGILSGEVSAKRIDSSIKSFQKSIDGTTKPVFVPLLPRDDSLPNDCFENVRRQIDEKGGEIIHGWRVFTLPSVFHEAEFHAVWKSPQGELLDVSLPPEEGTRRIVFFPDPTRSFQGEPLLNRHWPLIHIRALREYFEATDSMKVAERELIRRNGIQYNEPYDREDPALSEPRTRLVTATIALCAALKRRQ